MPDERTRDEKLASYRERYPLRVEALNKLVAPLLGVHARTKLSAEAVAEICRPVVDAAIAASWGLE